MARNPARTRRTPNAPPAWPPQSSSVALHPLCQYVALCRLTLFHSSHHLPPAPSSYNLRTIAKILNTSHLHRRHLRTLPPAAHFLARLLAHLQTQKTLANQALAHWHGRFPPCRGGRTIRTRLPGEGESLPAGPGLNSRFFQFPACPHTSGNATICPGTSQPARKVAEGCRRLLKPTEGYGQIFFSEMGCSLRSIRASNPFSSKKGKTLPKIVKHRFI